VNLDVVRDALLADARAEAATTLAEVTEWADRELADARRTAAGLLEASEDAGRADAEADLALARAAARREARRLVLVAESQVRRELMDRARAAVQSLRSEPGYERLLRELESLARSQLGVDATVVVDDQFGGLVGTAPGRRVDYTLPVLVERGVDAMGPEVERLWR